MPHFRSLAPDLSPVWSKIPAMRKALENGHEWAWWLDLDTLVTNLNIPLIDIVNGNALDRVEAEEKERTGGEQDPNDLPEPKDIEEERAQRHVLTAGDNGGKPIKRRLKWTMDDIHIIVSNDWYVPSFLFFLMFEAMDSTPAASFSETAIGPRIGLIESGR
jgi:hypothetical protein